ncbi:MAG: SprT-like domain-containing protein [Gammaproteobacteria bacterium]|nr:SprT-like domain-containing protein [Gammaproteobacteria bacterium]
MSTISPIDNVAKQEVTALTQHYIELAADHFKRDIPAIEVLFDLKGQAAGMYRVRRNQRCIRYNPWLFAKYYQDNLANTVPHEVAHYICDRLYGLRRIKPHGNEWRDVMMMFGAEPQRTCHYELDGIPRRRQQRHPYRCACREHELSAVRHRRHQSGRAQYLCRYCKQPLISVR